MADIERARAAKRTLRGRLAETPGIIGIGLGRSGEQYVVTVSLLAEHGLAGDQRIEEIDGVPVEYRVTTDVRALSEGP